MLAIIDECTRECLAIDVSQKLNHDDGLERLSWLMATRGVPGHIQSDNGSEFTAKAVRSWLRVSAGEDAVYYPKKPLGEWLNRELQWEVADELLEREVFDTLYEAMALIERWRVHYKTIKPHRSSGYRPPVPEMQQV